MDKKTIYILVILAVISIAVVTYGVITLLETISEQQEQISEYQQVTLVDAMGNVVTLTSAPERIVSLAPSNTETLFLVGAGDNVVGVTDYCDYPYDFSAWIEAGNMSSIGNYYGPSVEPIVALDPDLVFASTGSLEAAATLKSLGYNVLVVEGQTLEAILQDIHRAHLCSFQQVNRPS